MKSKKDGKGGKNWAKQRKHTKSYISSKWKIVVGELVDKIKKNSKYGDDYYFLKLKVANKLTDLYCQIDWRDENGEENHEGDYSHCGYPHTSHYSFLSIDRVLFDFESKAKNLKVGKIYIFEYYRDSMGYPLLISASPTQAKKATLEKLWEIILFTQQKETIELIQKAKYHAKKK